jgi:transcriptional regulator with XRE-family HTH domain
VAHQTHKLEQAARAAWLAHVAGLTQDEIAGVMGVSRQTAQRLVAQAVAEGLVKIRIDHPFADCLQMAADLRARWRLQFCEIAPADAPEAGMAHHLAATMECWLRRPEPLTLAIGTGRPPVRGDGPAAPYRLPPAQDRVADRQPRDRRLDRWPQRAVFSCWIWCPRPAFRCRCR